MVTNGPYGEYKVKGQLGEQVTLKDQWWGHCGESAPIIGLLWFLFWSHGTSRNPSRRIGEQGSRAPHCEFESLMRKYWLQDSTTRK